jgi:hypothetical protein
MMGIASNDFCAHQMFRTVFAGALEEREFYLNNNVVNDQAHLFGMTLHDCRIHTLR